MTMIQHRDCGDEQEPSVLVPLQVLRRARYALIIAISTPSPAGKERIRESLDEIAGIISNENRRQP